jgi:hypothetical protein
MRFEPACDAALALLDQVEYFCEPRTFHHGRPSGMGSWGRSAVISRHHTTTWTSTMGLAVSSNVMPQISTPLQAYPHNLPRPPRHTCSPHRVYPSFNVPPGSGLQTLSRAGNAKTIDFNLEPQLQLSWLLLPTTLRTTHLPSGAGRFVQGLDIALALSSWALSSLKTRISHSPLGAERFVCQDPKTTLPTKTKR